MDGVEVCRRLRQACDAAIIIVTARGEETDRVLALDEGADDYLIKPFGLQELLARIRAVLRRSKQPAGQPQVLQHGPLTVDLRTHKVSVNGSQIAADPDPETTGHELAGALEELARLSRLVTSNGGTAKLTETPGGGLTAILEFPGVPAPNNTGPNNTGAKYPSSTQDLASL
jgi:DNA-binding response OmpR family regulator